VSISVKRIDLLELGSVRIGLVIKR
jgi:hypothetical protein